MMTKKEFEITEEPLCMIVSLDPSTGKVLYDTYDWRAQEGWMKDFKKNFPEMMHFSILNPAAIRERKKRFGLLS